MNTTYDSLLRRQFLQASRGGNVLTNQTYTYDPGSRLETITSGSQTATYAYYPNSGLLNTTAFTGGTNIARSYDALGRLQTITTTPAADAAQSYTYTYNNLHQRTRVTREDGSYWSYAYNDRGELVSGRKYWADATPVWGDQTEYSFDNIGNRNYARNGGNQLGSLRQSNYTTNSLNQYSQRTVAGAVDVTGTANASATVSVNNQATARKGDYFYRELAIDNSASPAYAQVNVVGARNSFGAGGEDAVTENGGRAFVPQVVESFSHDADGNLTTDGRWTYTWDAENRLTSMQAIASVPIEAKQRLEFSYDYMGRRIQKKVYVWNQGTSSYQLSATAKFIYDGWNLVAELDGNNAPIRSYVWGQDVSGSLQRAGGISGLLLVSESGQTYQVGYDGNGNVTTLVKASTGTLSASYEYDPFGNTIRATGEYAAKNPVRFSTKYTDAETNLVYYGFRYYQPQTGQWLSRDPIEEAGGVNLYGFVGNDPVSNIDPFGLYEIDVHYYLTYYLTRQTGCFSKEQAKRIGEGNQRQDEDENYAPAQRHGMLPESIEPLGEAGSRQRERHEIYHALTDPANHPANLQRLLGPALQGGQRNRPAQMLAFGQYLHYLQDTFSHAGFENPWYGHFFQGHHPDQPFRTPEQVEQAMRMARETYTELAKYAMKLKCCKASPIDDGNVDWVLVRKFLSLPGGDFLHSISGADLEAKRQLLSLPRR